MGSSDSFKNSRVGARLCARRAREALTSERSSQAPDLCLRLAGDAAAHLLAGLEVGDVGEQRGARHIKRALGGQQADIQRLDLAGWVVTGYFVSYAVSTIVCAAMSFRSSMDFDFAKIAARTADYDTAESAEALEAQSDDDGRDQNVRTDDDDDDLVRV